MASTYVNNLRLEEMATGEQSGTWGTKTNTNLELIGQSTAWGTRAIADASTDNITIADGSADADRCLGLKLTGGGQACTVTLLPNTSSKTWFMYNATSYTLTFTCGSGANVAIPAGQTKVIATDGLGSGGVVHDLLTGVSAAGDLNVAGDVITAGTLQATGDTAAGDDAALGYTAAEGLILTGQGSTNDVTIKNDADADVIEIPTGTVNVTMAGTLGVTGVVSGAGFTAGSAVISEAELELLDGVTAGTAIASKVVTTDANIDTTGQRNLTISGELDAATGDFSGAVDIAGALTLGGTDLAVSHGGTGAGTFAANGVIFGNGTSALGATAVGTDGHVLTSNGSGSAPTFQSAGGGITIGTPQATGTASSVTFTGIPSGTNQIEVSYFGITFSTSAVARLRLGDSGGLETSGYLSSVGSHTESTNHTDHMALHNSGMTSAGASCVIQLSRVTGNSWSMHSVSRGNLTNSASATKTLSGEITQLQLFTNSGNFTAGTIQIITE